MSNLTDFYGEPISVYTREQAIEDGVLVDVTELAHSTAGFRVAPVALTSACWAAVSNQADDGDVLEATISFLRDALALVRAAVASRGDRAGEEPIEMLWSDARDKPHTYWIVFNSAEGFTIGEAEDF